MKRQRPQSRRPAVAVLAFAALLIGLIGGLAPSAGAESSAQTVTGGSLDWGLKASFRGYINSPGSQGGSITVGGGATINGDGTFHFPAKAGGTVDRATENVAAAFDGSLKFVGHPDGQGGWILDVSIDNIRVEADGATGAIVADVVSRSQATGLPETFIGIAVADLDLTGITPTTDEDTTTWASVPGTLATDGVPAFGGSYTAGTVLDPATFALDLEEIAPTTTTTEATSTTSTTSTTVEPTTSTTVIPTDEVDITGGYLDWGVKKGFVNYIKSPGANGSVTVSGGAVDNFAADGTFRFPALAQGTFNGATNATDATFAGSVRFLGHPDGTGGYALDIALSNLRVVRDATGSWLVADAVSLTFSGTGGSDPVGAPVTYLDLKLAALDTTGVLPTATAPNGLTWHDVPSSLTADGVPVFGNYAAGEAFDPVTYSLTLAEVPDVPVDPDGPTVPVALLDKTQVRAGDSLTVTGEGFLAGEQVEVWLHSTPTWIGTTTADAAGAVAYTFVVPTDTPAGVHHIELLGISSGTSLSSAEFTVLAGSGSGSGTGTPTGTKASTGTLPRTGGGLDLVRVGGFLVAAGAALTLVVRRRTRTA